MMMVMAVMLMLLKIINCDEDVNDDNKLHVRRQET